MKKPTSPSRSGPSARRRWRRAIQCALVFFGGAVTVHGLLGDKGLLMRLEAREEYRALEVSLAVSRSANASLRQEVRRLTEDEAAIENLARGELGFIRPGEILFILTAVDPAGRR